MIQRASAAERQTQDASQPQERTIMEERIAKDQWAAFLKDCDHTEGVTA